MKQYKTLAVKTKKKKKKKTSQKVFMKSENVWFLAVTHSQVRERSWVDSRQWQIFSTPFLC